MVYQLEYMLSEKNCVDNRIAIFYFRSMWKVKVCNNNPGAEGEEKEGSHNILLQYVGILVNEVLCYGGIIFN
jgi:hypothetical protein